MKACQEGHAETVKLLLAQEGIDINAKNKIVYFNKLRFLYNTWNLLKLFQTAFMCAACKNSTEIVKSILEQEGVDINAKDD